MTHRTLATVAFTILAGITGMVLGGWIAVRITSERAGEQAMVALQNELSALGYLENKDHRRAHYMLRLAVENNLVLLDRYGTPSLDKYDADAVSRWVKQYQRIRGAHPPIDYKDSGALAAQIDRIVQKHLGTDQTP